MKLSIVITAYNVENHIERTLSSLICQTVKEYEVIVVDDGSTDGTYRTAKEILDGFKVTEHKLITGENGGVGFARNKGLKEASGEYVMFLDGDDYVANNLIERIYNSLNRQMIDVICWGYDTVDEDQAILANYFDTYEQGKRLMTGAEALNSIFISRAMWLWTGSAAYRKDLLTENQLNYTEGCANGEDQEFSIKALSRANSIVFLSEILSFYVQRHGSITSSHSVRKFDAVRALKRAVGYLRNTGEVGFMNLVDIIETQHIVESYFNNLDSCMTNANIRTLLDQINESYPGLNREIKGNMKRYLRRKIEFNKYHIKCRLFLISPKFYAVVVFLKRKAISLRKVG